jgi:hypothetical protein
MPAVSSCYRLVISSMVTPWPSLFAMCEVLLTEHGGHGGRPYMIASSPPRTILKSRSLLWVD